MTSAIAKKHGGGRTTVGNGLDIHGNRISRFDAILHGYDFGAATAPLANSAFRRFDM